MYFVTTGAFNQDECEEVYVLTEASGTLTVGSIGTVCFQCLYDNSTDPETQWTLESEPISNSTGTTFNGHLAIFAARQVFRVDSPLMLQCMGTLTYTYATTIRGLHARGHFVCHNADFLLQISFLRLLRLSLQVMVWQVAHCH